MTATTPFDADRQRRLRRGSAAAVVSRRPRPDVGVPAGGARRRRRRRGLAVRQRPGPQRSARTSRRASTTSTSRPASRSPAATSARRQPVSDALVEGLLNTLRLAVTGIVLATVLGTLLGIARLSKNFLVRKAAQAYVEVIRNVPLFGLIVLLYTAVVLNAFPPPNESWESGRSPCSTSADRASFWFEGGNTQVRHRPPRRRARRSPWSPAGGGR